MAVNIVDLGVVRYEDAVKKQKEFFGKRIEDQIEDTVLLLEHPPVVTLGKSASRNNIRDYSFFASRGIEIVNTDRGGGITYHAPGQLIVYPVIKLDPPMRDVSAFIDLLEKMTAGALQDIGVSAGRRQGRRGVWVSEKKIAFIGIKLRRWVTFHGIAVNINNDIFPFEMIDPCGEADIKVTSARVLKGDELDMGEVKKVFSKHFSNSFKKGLVDVIEIA